MLISIDIFVSLEVQYLVMFCVGIWKVPNQKSKYGLEIEDDN